MQTPITRVGATQASPTCILPNRPAAQYDDARNKSATAECMPMLRGSRRSPTVAIGSAIVVLLTSAGVGGQRREPSPASPDDSFRFRTGVEFVSVPITVTDAKGHFVPGLTREDFRLYEDGQAQEIIHFSSERVPVSLGMAIDASGSMAGHKWESAVNAVERLFDLLRSGDEVFLYRFSSDPELVHDWTGDYRRILRGLKSIEPDGGTALHDAVAQALRRAQTGRHRKKAVLVLSDGNDNSSDVDLADLRKIIRETDVMVYSIAIAGDAQRVPSHTPQWFPPRRTPFPIPFPRPGDRLPRRPSGWEQLQWSPGHAGATRRGPGDGANVALLRDITDESGGRTEVVRSARDLNPSTASIADELNQQYYLAYRAAANKDGRWHAIRVETRDTRLHVRARRGYTATP
jgi:VWFA-related protein